jgi:two-component system cell cycle response regulator
MTSKRGPASENPLLQQDYLQLQAAFQDLLEQAHINQQIMQRHQAFDIHLLGTNDLPDLLDTILRGMAEAYELQTVTLFLIDPQYDMQRIVAQLKLAPESVANLHFVECGEQLGAAYASQCRPALACYQAAEHHRFFFDATPASVAIMPLLRHRQQIGFLALGSSDTARFSTHLATDFLERQASFIAICIENAVNYEKLKLIGLTDPLTGVHNRRYIEQRMRGEIGNAQRQESALSCLYIDIDYFKLVNDSVGHQAGDDVLCEVAARIKRELRINDAMGRFGGEEFIVLLTQTGHAAALQIAERIRANVAAETVRYQRSERVGDGDSGDRLQVTISIGVVSCAPALHEKATAVLEHMIARADQALYQAKKNGRNQIMSALQLAPADAAANA